MSIPRYIKAIFKGFVTFFKGNRMMLAAALTFFSTTAIIPFCLLLLAFFDYILGANIQFLEFFTSRLERLFPDITSEFMDKLKELLSIRGVGGITLVIYVFQSYQFFIALEFALNIILKTKSYRHFIVSIILSLLLVTWLVILILASFGASSAIAMLIYYEDMLPFLEIDRITGFLIGFAIPMLLIFVAVASVFLIVPKKRISLRNAFAGAFITTLFLEGAKYIFTIIIGNVLSLGLIYGSLSVSIIFLLWMFYSWCIFLIGAEFVHILEG
jgi:membrane protein